MAISLIPLLAVLVPLLLLAGGLVVLARTQRRHRDRAESERRSLRYRVEPGEDPVSIVAALNAAGFDAVSDGDDVLVVGDTDPERDRARVREAVAAAPVSLGGDPRPGRVVRFVDEQGGRGTRGP